MATFTGSNSGEVLPLIPAQALGDDTIYGRGGNDILVGYTGNDVLNGGTGADVLIGGTLNVKLGLGTTKLAGSDTADYSTSKLGVSIDLSSIQSISVDLLGIKTGAMEGVRGAGGDAQGDRLFGISNLTGSAAQDYLSGDADANILTGNGGDDLLVGREGDDVIYGGAGDDYLDGGRGLDRMSGGIGDDFYLVDNVGDRVVELSNSGNDTVRSTVSFTLTGSLNNLILFYGGATSGKGNNLANTMTGNGSSNVLTGGLGDDTFVFNATLGSGNVDKITDFRNVSGNNDHFELENAVFKGLAVGTLSASALFVGTQAHDSSDRIIYDKAHGDLYFDRDGTGTDYARVKFAEVSDNTTLTALDFIII